MILKTERLILRPWKETDAEALYKYAKDDQIGPIAGWPPHKNVEESLDIIRNIFMQEGVFAVTRHNDDEAIGCISLILGEKSNFPIPDTEGEVSYWLGVPHWGQGLIPEAIKELIRHGFEDLKLDNIWCGYYADNSKSERAQSKAGFRLHHIEKNRFNPYMNDVRVEHISRLTKAEWLELQ